MQDGGRSTVGDFEVLLIGVRPEEPERFGQSLTAAMFSDACFFAP